MKGRFADNPSYVEYETLLLTLHDMIARGQGDSEAADVIRDRMDAPWSQLDSEEVARINGLSADLYMLSGEEIPESPAPPGHSPEQQRADLTEARAGGQAERALALLRSSPRVLPEPDIAAMRAWAYEVLGHQNAAKAFTSYATRLSYLTGRNTRPFQISFWHCGLA